MLLSHRLMSGAAALAQISGVAHAQSQTSNAAPQAPASAAAATVTDQSAAGQAAPTASGSSATVQEVVVTGFRASLQSAQNIKRNSPEIVDSIVAADIGKLPDLNTAEALQRVTGVQITRDLGEGSTVAVRGLTQVETTVNGHEIFTAAGGRTLNFEDLPSELLAGVDVYKSQAANLIEGGLGGSINARTHRPFDFSGPEFDGSAMANYGDLAHRWQPQGSILASDRWDTGIGQVGALFSASYQKRDFRENYASAGAPIAVNSGGALYRTSNGPYNLTYTGDRERLGLDGVLQWRPTPELEFYAEANYSAFKTQQYDYGITVPTFAGLTPINITPYSGTNIASSSTFRNEQLNSIAINRSQNDQQQQYSVGGKWNHGPFSLTGDFNYTKAAENLYYTELDADQQIASGTLNVAGGSPTFSANGANLANEAGYAVGGLTDSINHYFGDETALRLDGEYKTDGVPIVTALDMGFRYADTQETFDPIRYYQAHYATSGVGNHAITNYPGLFGLAPYGTQVGSVYSANAQALTNINSVISQLASAGFTGGPVLSPQSVFQIDEKTYAGYAMLKYGFNALVPVDGNIGVRIIATDDQLNGNLYNATNQTLTPLNRANDYVDVLPSLNTRFKLRNDLLLRVGVYKSLTRPDFSSLSPALTLLPSNLTGSSGNPDLKPLRANNVDVSLEWYFTRTSSITGTAFYKKVDGFPLTIGTQTAINLNDGRGVQTYVISEPQNSGSGEIKGAEVGYQQFFDFLPGPLSGLGAQANFTYVDSVVPSSVAGFSSQLPNLSRYQYNLVGIYEKGPVSARVAYNWRSSYVNSIYVGAVGVGVLPVDTKAFGWLDAAVNYNVTKNLTLSLEGSNLLQTRRQGYYSTQLLPNFAEIDDRQILVGAHFHW